MHLFLLSIIKVRVQTPLCCHTHSEFKTACVHLYSFLTQIVFYVDNVNGKVRNLGFFSLFLGFHSLCITVALLLLCLGLGMPLGYLFELVLPLAVCAIALSYLLSMYLYIRSFWAPKYALSLGGNTGEILSALL